MIRTIIYAVMLLILAGAELLFIIRTDCCWSAQRKIKKRLLSSENEEEQGKHQYAFTNATVESLSWTAISACGFYGCFNCLVDLLNTL